MLTGYKDVDLKILMKLDDEKLISFCKITWRDEYSRKLCKNEDFWRNRTFNEYGNVEKNPDRTWKNFYLGIFHFKKISVDKAIEELSKDKENNYDLIEIFEIYKSFSKASLNKGIFIKSLMISFLKTINFEDKIREHIDPLLEQGILSRPILTFLFSIYILNHKLRFEENGKLYVKTNKEIDDIFDISKIEDPTHMKSSNTRSIISQGIIKPPYTFKEKRYIFSPEIVLALENAFKVIN